MRAVILGGTGATGSAVAQRLARQGWDVALTGRHRRAMPPELSALGVGFHPIERTDYAAINTLVGNSTELLVDLLAFRASDLHGILPALTMVRSSVVISSRAVYLDSRGRHINGPDFPCFPIPLQEIQPTIAPAGPGIDPFSREGYAPSKAAVELAALNSGLPISIVRPSKVHGRWARNARTAAIVGAMRPEVDRLFLPWAHSIDHLSAASNIAALIEVLAHRPSARILNCADPDPLTTLEIVGHIARHLGWTGEIVASTDSSGSTGSPATLINPWAARHPIILDISAAQQLGYEPVGTAADLLAEEVTWVCSSGSAAHEDLWTARH